MVSVAKRFRFNFVVFFFLIAYIGEAVGEDMVFLEEIRLSSNFLSTVEVFFNNFITSVPA